MPCPAGVDSDETGTRSTRSTQVDLRYVCVCTLPAHVYAMNGTTKVKCRTGNMPNTRDSACQCQTSWVAAQVGGTGGTEGAGGWQLTPIYGLVAATLCVCVCVVCASGTCSCQSAERERESWRRSLVQTRKLIKFMLISRLWHAALIMGEHMACYVYTAQMKLKSIGSSQICIMAD